MEKNALYAKVHLFTLKGNVFKVVLPITTPLTLLVLAYFAFNASSKPVTPARPLPHAHRIVSTSTKHAQKPALMDISSSNLPHRTAQLTNVPNVWKTAKNVSMI